MKNPDIVLNYIKNKVTEEYILNCIEKDIAYGVNAEEIQENLKIVRNNASTILNKLWKSSNLIKIDTRPVAFIPKDVIKKLWISNNNLLKDNYERNELNKLISKTKLENLIDDPFEHLIGSNGSISNQISQAKAAIIYPPKGLHTLILGDSGVGKTTFAYAMHEFGKIKKGLSDKDFPFIAFNCSDYFNNPQLLLSQLFGHCKGAFTGADNEKPGLVEKADGGILFLDEIHRLPPDGQEMLFYLMDKGEYHRMGETGSKRKSNVLIIAATTEEPTGALLATFLRRIPVIITLPPFRGKTLDEKIDIIQNSFSYEAKNLKKKIRILPQVLKALALYKFNVGNIGQLRSEVKLLCAKSFLQYLENAEELIIEFKMLNKSIRENAFSYSNKDIDINRYLDRFSEGLIVFPSAEKEYYHMEPQKDIYELIIKTLDELKLKGLSKEIIESEIKSLIDTDFKHIINSFNSNRFQINQLYKIVPKDITDFCVKLIKISEDELSTKLNNKFIFGFALHIQSLLKRILEEKPIKNPNIIKIKKDYPEEFRVAKILVKLLNERFKVTIPEDEKGFLAILLANNELGKKSESNTKIFVICHGYSTATSIANVANTLLNTEFVQAFDMPLDADITETYNKVKSAVLATNKCKGILFLVDMGSLVNFGEKLMDETGIKIKTIDNVSTLLVIEALKNVLYKNQDLNEIYNSLINKDLNFNTLKENETKKKAILTFCTTGQGASMIAKNILKQILANEYSDKLEILTFNYVDSEKNIDNLRAKYDILAVIGSFKPNVDIPYFPINKLLNDKFQKEFLKFLDTNLNYAKANVNNSKNVYETSKEMLEQYVKFLNPKIAITNIKKFIESLKLDYANEDQDELIDLIIHTGCMLDRCIHGAFVKFENMDEYREKNIKQFNRIRNSINIFENEYNIKINDDEICYIIKIITR